jgi:hypothetical protein
MKLEYVDSLTLAHPFIKGFEQVSYCLSDEEVRAVALGDISDAIMKRKKEDIEDKEGGSPVHSTTFYIGLAIEPKLRAWPSTARTISVFNSHHLPSWRCWSSAIGHIVSHHRIHEAGQNVGKIRRGFYGHCCQTHQEVISNNSQTQTDVWLTYCCPKFCTA